MIQPRSQHAFEDEPPFMPGLIHIERHVPQEHAGKRLDQVAAELFPDFSRARLQAWIRQGALTVDRRSQRPAFRLGGGECLVLEAEPEAEGRVEAQPIALELLYADEHLLVLDKRAGLVVHPAAGNPDGTLQNALLHYDPALAGIPRAGIVHRLDKDTSGVMVVARSLKAHAALVRQLQGRHMSRVYETVVHGITPEQGAVDAPVGRDPRNRQRMAVIERGKPALSHYRCLRHFAHFSHLEVALETGRRHQIRVHMADIGFPLVGDPVYGRRLGKKLAVAPAARAAVEAFPRQALHARELRLSHPETGRQMRFEAPVPADFRALLQALERSDPLTP